MITMMLSLLQIFKIRCAPRKVGAAIMMRIRCLADVSESVSHIRSVLSNLT